MLKMNNKYINNQITFWKKSAKESLEAAIVLYKNNHFDSCLFFCHLSLEKYLKSLVAKKTNEPAPYIHDLAKLANIADLMADEELTKNLRIITTFNIAGRYSDSKASFYKLVNKKYCEKYLNITKEIFLWLEKEFQKK